MITYIITDVISASLVDFSQILETSSATLRVSLDGTQAVLKWEGDEPPTIANLSSYEGPYTHSEILTIMETAAWSNMSPTT